jgi:hypothetical protein
MEEQKFNTAMAIATASLAPLTLINQTFKAYLD